MASLFFLQAVIALVGLRSVAFATSEPSPCDPSLFKPTDIITRDIAIIGGGAAGTYSAFRLQDNQQSVVVIEKLPVLGGHTQTFKDPQTGLTVDIGVQEWHNLTIVRNFFQRFNVSLIPSPLDAAMNPESFVEFSTGLTVPQPAAADPTQAFSTYLDQLNKYPGLINGFDLPDPVPEDLLLPWGQFIAKFGLQSMSGIVFIAEEGYVPLLDLPTLYIVKQFTQDLLMDAVTGSFLTTQNHDNHAIYDAAQAILEEGGNVLVNATIVAMDRDGSDYARIAVKTPSGTKLVQAEKIVFAIPPHVPAIKSFFDFDALEFGLFSQFQHCGYYTGLLRNTGLPANVTITNTGSNNATLDIPTLPGSYAFTQTRIPGVFSVFYGTPNTMGRSPSVAEVKADIVAELKRLRNSGFNTTDDPEFAIFSSHDPFLMNVPVDAVRNGFYKQLNTLQGHRRTWYTGATWQTHDSSAIWNFTEFILPDIVKGTGL